MQFIAPQFLVTYVKYAHDVVLNVTPLSVFVFYFWDLLKTI